MKMLMFFCLLFISCLGSAQLVLKGSVNGYKNGNGHRSIFGFNYTKLDFKELRPGANSKFHLLFDSVNNTYIGTIDLVKPSIIELQVDNLQNYVYARPGDTLYFSVNYIDGVEPLEEDLNKGYRFPQKNALVKKCTISFTGRNAIENIFLNQIQKDVGIFCYSRFNFDNIDLSEYQKKEVCDPYYNRLSKLDSFCKTNKNDEFAKLVTELIDATFLKDLLSPCFYSKKISTDYFNDSIVQSINAIVSKKSELHYLFFAKWQLSATYLNGLLYEHNRTADYYVRQFGKSAQFFKEKEDFNMVSSFILSNMINDNIFQDSLVKEYAKWCTNKQLVADITSRYQSRKIELSEGAQNISSVFLKDTILDHNDQYVDITKLMPVGKFLLLDFWATWCKPCLVNTNELYRIMQKEKDFFGIEVIGLSLDMDKKAWKKFISSERKEKAEKTINSYFVKNSFSSNVTQTFGINSIPRYILVAPDGKVIDINLPQPIHESEFLNRIRMDIGSYKSRVKKI